MEQNSFHKSIAHALAGVAWAMTLLALSTTNAVAGVSDCRGAHRSSDGRLIDAGTSEARVMKSMGAPDRYIQLENKYGAAVGERWVYYIDGINARTVNINLSGGVVTSVCRIWD